VLADIARTNGSAQRKKSALPVDLLRAALLTIDGATLKGKRDRALLLLGFAGRYAGYGDRNESAGSTFTENRRARPYASSRPRTLRFSVTPT
jgi:hypothetical protein